MRNAPSCMAVLGLTSSPGTWDGSRTAVSMDPGNPHITRRSTAEGETLIATNDIMKVCDANASKNKLRIIEACLQFCLTNLCNFPL